MSKVMVWRTSHVVDLMNLSAVHILAGDHTLALAMAEDGLREAATMSNSYATAGLASNAGEACYYLGRHEDAIRYAEQCIGCEEAAHLP